MFPHSIAIAQVHYIIFSLANKLIDELDVSASPCVNILIEVSHQEDFHLFFASLYECINYLQLGWI
jgi:hypothetical protein